MLWKVTYGEHIKQKKNIRLLMCVSDGPVICVSGVDQHLHFNTNSAHMWKILYLPTDFLLMITSCTVKTINFQILSL